MPHVTRLRVFPVKSLDGIDVSSTTLGEGGALALDREYAMFDADGDYVNGKATAAVHRLDSTFDPDTHDLTLSVTDPGPDEPADEPTFRLRDDDERAALSKWLTDFFGYPVTVERDDRGGYPDDTELHGPTVISTGTVREVADWFDLPAENVRRRFRANVEIDAAEPFWEDRLFGDHGEVVDFEVGDVPVEGVNPCQRCVVPSRDPDTGAEDEGFRERFVEKRRETVPPWTDSDRFDHYFRLMLNTTVPKSAWGSEVGVGDAVTVGERREIA
jgi:uncharacterized protein YcbX